MRAWGLEYWVYSAVAASVVCNPPPLLRAVPEYTIEGLLQGLKNRDFEIGQRGIGVWNRGKEIWNRVWGAGFGVLGIGCRM